MDLSLLLENLLDPGETSLHPATIWKDHRMLHCRHSKVWGLEDLINQVQSK